MYNMVSKYASDLGDLSKMPLQAFYDKVRLIPYRRDVLGQETVARPSLLLSEFPALDCKKKSILMGSYLLLNGIPFRFIASSQRKDAKFHHVYVQAKIGDTFKNVDATYAKYKLFEPKRGLTRIQVLKP